MQGNLKTSSVNSKWYQVVGRMHLILISSPTPQRVVLRVCQGTKTWPEFAEVVTPHNNWLEPSELPYGWSIPGPELVKRYSIAGEPTSTSPIETGGSVRDGKRPSRGQGDSSNAGSPENQGTPGEASGHSQDPSEDADRFQMYEDGHGEECYLDARLGVK
jgi:hypothetical protein